MIDNGQPIGGRKMEIQQEKPALNNFKGYGIAKFKKPSRGVLKWKTSVILIVFLKEIILWRAK